MSVALTALIWLLIAVVGVLSAVGLVALVREPFRSHYRSRRPDWSVLPEPDSASPEDQR